MPESFLSVPEPAARVATPMRVLHEIFGFAAFRGLQAEAIGVAMAGADALVLMPTGGGKSLCYQIPALCRPGVGLVVSPLIALMQDQVLGLRQMGVRASALHSELAPEEARAVWSDLVEGRLDLLYASPERVLAGRLLDQLARQPVSLVAIDEAHCVSQWGHEFRPEYRALSCLAERLPGVPRMALTATADQGTRADIVAALGMPSARVLVSSFHRPNLRLAAAEKDSETAQLLAFLAARPGQTGIVYARTRARVERFAARLAARGVASVAFHAGLERAQKRDALARFRSGDAVVVVATIAFGMGIDRPDVRFVVHLDMPESPEAYYQQIGRAGRDGLQADALLLFGAEDVARARYFLTQSNAPAAELGAMRDRLERMIALTETAACRTAQLLACFGETLPAPCGHCDTCRDPPESFDGTEAAQMVLSAAYRTGQLFGALHLIAVLRGDLNDKIRRHGHDRLPIFGIGRSRSVAFWRGVIRQMVAMGALAARTDGASPGDTGYAPLGLALVSEVARPILRGERALRLRSAPRVAASSARSPRDPAARDPAAGAAGASPLFGRLKAWRSALAASQHVPPYVIFHDAVLLEVVASRPASLAELRAIKGVGASKLARYGPSLLACLADSGSATRT